MINSIKDAIDITIRSVLFLQVLLHLSANAEQSVDPILLAVLNPSHTSASSSEQWTHISYDRSCTDERSQAPADHRGLDP